MTRVGNWFRWRVGRPGSGMRGRIHSISIVRGGEVSVVVRFGMDEPVARQMLQGTLVEVVELRSGIIAKDPTP